MSHIVGFQSHGQGRDKRRLNVALVSLNFLSVFFALAFSLLSFLKSLSSNLSGSILHICWIWLMVDVFIVSIL